MCILRYCCGLFFLLAVSGRAAPQVAKPSSAEFEVAEIKLARDSQDAPQGLIRRGTQVTFKNYTLLELVADAFEVKDYRVLGPAILKATRVDVIAKTPSISSLKDLHAMLRNLLAREFQLRINREARESKYYVLSIEKDGIKMVASDLRSPSNASAIVGTPARSGKAGASMEPKKDRLSFPIIQEFDRQGRRFVAFGDGRSTIRGRRQSIADIVEFISSQLDYDVIDHTELTGEYDFVLNWVSDLYKTTGDGGDVEPAGETLLDALRRQLGLRLDRVEGPIDIVVIDHMNVPKGN